MRKLTLGDFELTIISDGTYPLDGGAFFGVVPKVMWSRKAPPDERNFITAGLNSLLIRTGKQNILVETGMGNKLPDKMVKVYGQPAKLLENLQAAGVAPDEIDIVINTHLHFDHCGWNTIRQGDRVVPTFPKAKYYVQEGEWQHAQEQHIRDAISYISDNYNPLIKAGQMQLLRGDQEIVPGNFSARLSGPHDAYAGGRRDQRRQDGLLHLRSDSHERTHRSHVGDGLRPVADRHDRQQEAVLRAGVAGEVADGVYARRCGAVRVCGEG